MLALLPEGLGVRKLNLLLLLLLLLLCWGASLLRHVSLCPALAGAAAVPGSLSGRRRPSTFSPCPAVRSTRADGLHKQRKCHKSWMLLRRRDDHAHVLQWLEGCSTTQACARANGKAAHIYF
jgi:hypothetical protein